MSNIGVPTGYTPIEKPIQTPPQREPVSIVNRGFIRCPLPPIWVSNVDNINASDLDGKVPQQRIYTKSLV